MGASNNGKGQLQEERTALERGVRRRKDERDVQGTELVVPGDDAVSSTARRAGAGRAAPDNYLVFSLITGARRFRFQNELPRLLQQESGQRQIITVEARRRLPLFAVAVRPLQRHFVKG